MRSLIEFAENPITNYDYFCVDSTEDGVSIGDRTMPKCQVTYDVLSLGEEYAYELGTLGGALYEKYSVFMMNGENAKTTIELKNLIVGVIDFIVSAIIKAKQKSPKSGAVKKPLQTPRKSDTL